MRLTEIIDLNKGQVISIVGAGGKTTLMFTMAEELRKGNKVLITTTTKIYIPSKNDFQFMFFEGDNVNLFNNSVDNGIYIYGNSVNSEYKIIGTSDNELEKLLPYYDYIFIEADGSKRKPLKGWNYNEPVISKYTNITIGVITIEVLGMMVNESNIHRIEKFMALTGTKEHERIRKEHIVSLIFNPEGLFKNSLGKRILFVNKLDMEKDFNLTSKLLQCIAMKNREYELIDSIIFGSLKNKTYEYYQLPKGGLESD